MDLTEIGCQALRLPFIYSVMDVVENFGHGLLPLTIGFALLVFGLIRKNHFYTRAGLAVFLSLAVAGLAAELLKKGLQIPRPLRDAPGFPSGHATASMSLAAVLGTVFPQWSFVFHLLAFMTGISRLYFRAHSVIDVFAGAGIGLVVGNLIARKLVRPLPQRNGYRIQRVGWAINAVVAVLALSHFLGFEREIRAHRIDNTAITRHKEILAVDFGNSEHAEFLRSGWSSDQAGIGGGVRAARAFGGTSLMQLALPAASDYLFFLRLNPLARDGTVCPQVQVKINDNQVTHMYLEFGWHWYQIRVPRSAMQEGVNQVAFYYTRSESSNPFSNRRQLPPSLAVDMLRIAHDQ